MTLPPEVIERLKKIGSEGGEALAQLLQKEGLSAYSDLAIVVFLSEAHKLAVLRNNRSTPATIVECMQVIDEVGAYARAEAERTLRAVGWFKESDG